MSESTGDLSTLIKLVRVSFLMPVVLAMLLVFRYLGRHNGLGNTTNVVTFPAFLLGFIALMLVNSMFVLPQQIIDIATSVSRFALIIAIAAIGIKSNLGQLRSVGMLPIVLIIGETIWIAGFILLAIYLV